MKDDNTNNSLPSIEDAMKSYESVINNPITQTNTSNSVNDNVVENSVSSNTFINTEELNNDTPPSNEVNTTHTYTFVDTSDIQSQSINNQPKTSLMQLLEEQEAKKAQNVVRDPNYYLQYYMGNAFDSFQRGGISFCYFFFGEYYLMYRKMYSFAIIKFIISFILLLVMSLTYKSDYKIIALICLAIYVALQIIPMFFVKKIYYDNARKFVLQKMQEKKSEKEIIQECMNKGGTSIVSVIILIVLLSLLNLIRAHLTGSITQLATNEIKIRNLSTLSTSYLRLDNNYYENLTSIIEDECFIKVSTDINNGDIYTFIEEEDFTTQDINGVTWFVYSNMNNNVYYASDDNYFYKVVTDVYNNSEKCQKSVDIFVNNLKFK